MISVYLYTLVKQKTCQRIEGRSFLSNFYSWAILFESPFGQIEAKNPHVYLLNFLCKVGE